MPQQVKSPDSSSIGQSHMHVVVIALTAALGGLLFGYDTGVISGALLFLREAFHLSPTMLGVVTGIALAGAAGGASVAGLLADRFGRRPTLIGTAAVFVAGAVVSALAGDLAVLLAGRLLVGIGIGGASMLTPLYLAEIAPARERGALVSFNQLAVTFGILGSYLIGYALASSASWRWMLGLGAVPGVVLAGGMLLLPETPRWLAEHGHVDRARAALIRLRGRGVDIEPEMKALRADLGSKAQTRPESRLGHRAARLPLIVGIGLAVFQQVTGINTVIYFAPTIFQASGLSSASAAILATAGVGVVNVVMTAVAIWLVDRVGRRMLLLTGLAGMGVSLCALATAFMMGSGPLLGWLTAGSLAAYVGFFAVGLGPVFWLLISEIFPLAIRGRGMSAATIANWLSNLVVALTFLDLVDLVGRPAVFFIYAALTFGALLFARALVPETRGLTLEAVEALWVARAKDETPHDPESREAIPTPAA
ncbi:sugar porter family MFS transporter [Lichenibacterium ramalinae]|uniref:Sugar porter family MFS transporter n=2 Tax=Lichenibacterium ramalinae TaxID=2316527 RepID=A0A4Q2RA79_9HYPH|nr:sugar porter family MFS transporter [Lichenibacterium ramalinae]